MKHLLSLLCVRSASAVHLTAAEPATNVLFMVSDDLRAGVLGCYGDKVCATPNIDRLAARGVVFDRARCQGTVCGPSRAPFMRGRYFGSNGVTLGEHFIAQGRATARAEKIFRIRVPGGIIGGTDGEDVAACWTERHNAPGQEAHTPGDDACLNLSIFTTELEGRQSTGDPHRPFVTVSYDTDGSEELYDKDADPGHVANRVAQPADATTLKNLRHQLEQRVNFSGGARKTKAKK